MCVESVNHVKDTNTHYPDFYRLVFVYECYVYRSTHTLSSIDRHDYINSQYAHQETSEPCITDLEGVKTILGIGI